MIGRVVGFVFTMAVVVALGLFLKWAGWQYSAGVLSGIVVMQYAHKAVYGTWIEF